MMPVCIIAKPDEIIYSISWVSIIFWRAAGHLFRSPGLPNALTAEVQPENDIF